MINELDVCLLVLMHVFMYTCINICCYFALSGSNDSATPAKPDLKASLNACSSVPLQMHTKHTSTGHGRSAGSNLPVGCNFKNFTGSFGTAQQYCFTRSRHHFAVALSGNSMIAPVILPAFISVNVFCTHAVFCMHN